MSYCIHLWILFFSLKSNQRDTFFIKCGLISERSSLLRLSHLYSVYFSTFDWLKKLKNTENLILIWKWCQLNSNLQRQFNCWEIWIVISLSRKRHHGGKKNVHHNNQLVDEVLHDFITKCFAWEAIYKAGINQLWLNNRHF